jgi:hypothetical protein
MSGVAAVLIASATQMISAAITGFSSIKDQQDTDNEICKKIDVTNALTSNVQTLINNLATVKTTIDPDIQQDILDLSGKIESEINAMKVEKKKFSTKILITLITNILLVAIVGIMLFS